jgi:hypothetical protein
MRPDGSELRKLMSARGMSTDPDVPSTSSWPVLSLTSEHFYRRHRPSLTLRDVKANTLEDLFDFDNAPSRDAVIPAAPPPSPSDQGCG